MSASFEIASAHGAYSVQIESDGFNRFLKEFDKPTIVADEFFEPRLAQSGHQVLFLEATESIKSLDACPRLIEELRNIGTGRKNHLVAIGGGILQDVSAFVASIYMRGLEWSYLPTTVLSMVDSCIGGKSSINVGGYKNLVGTFHPPNKILIDPALAATLPAHERAGGLIEAAKICFCHSPEAFARYLALNPSTEMTAFSFEQVITESLLAKKWFIEIDEFDKKERLQLNFGHTFGHAIEGASKYTISHGIAVGLGILCALEFGALSGTNSDKFAQTNELRQHLRELIIKDDGLAGRLKQLALDDLLNRLESDKKHTRDDFALLLIGENGRVALQKIPKNAESRNLLLRSFRKVLEQYEC
jgi:3-dehydroquinate synthase